MAEATLTSKGQVTIPADIRRWLKLHASDRITFTPMPHGTVLLRAKTASLDEVGGMLHRKERKAVPVDRMRMTAPRES